MAQSTYVPPKGLECADLTARKVHQYAIVALSVVGLLAGGVAGTAFVALAGAVMLAGRFWGPADVFRQFVWRVAEPRGWLTPNMAPEEEGTRRVARILGGVGLLAGAAALYAGSLALALVITLALCAMIALDATVNFCALCFVNFQARRLRYTFSSHRPAA